MKKRSLVLSTSKISCFKQCKKKYFFKYIQQIELPSSEAQITGKNYHKEVEKILKQEEYVKTPLTNAFVSFIKPKLPEIKKVEDEFSLSLAYGLKLRGFIDAVSKDGIPIEHKTSSIPIDEKFIYRLNWSEQASSYLLAQTLRRKAFHNRIIYTAIQKPTIRLKKTETPDQYEQRCNNWYKRGVNKINVFTVSRSYQEMEAWQNEVIEIAKEIKQCKNFYRNPSACSIMGCPYEGLCLDYSIDVEENNE